MLDYISWAEVKEQLDTDGREDLAFLFESYFSSRRYEAGLPALLEAVGAGTWGFEGEMFAEQS